MNCNKVTILQRILPHYRIPFFDGLHERLGEHGVSLQLIHGQEYPGTIPKSCAVDRDWIYRIDNRYLRFAGHLAVWQPCTEFLGNQDLIVMEQSNQLLLNYLLVLRLMARKSGLAYWGHGRNMQATDAKRVSESIKQWTTHRVGWWFAYTHMSKDILAASGFPAERITDVQNSIDTGSLSEAVRNTDENTLTGIRQRLGISGDRIGIYCGGMYPEKRLDFLLASCRLIKVRVPDFHILFIGSGPDAYKVKDAAAHCDWIHDLGPLYGNDRAPYLAMSKAFLMPGLVGLGIIDSFVATTPLFTTDNGIHSPEIAYLENRVNGIMTAESETAYANEVIGFLESTSLQATLMKGCADSARRYTLENMIDNFSVGIRGALSSIQTSSRRDSRSV